MKIAVLRPRLPVGNALPGLAADDNYIDDRSNAAALVRSLYNAVSRKEYGRAWDYFGDQKPAKTFDKFVEGYADTERVDVATGGDQRGRCGRQHVLSGRRSPSRRPTRTATRSVFAGCYTARLANPQIQGDAVPAAASGKGHAEAGLHRTVR